jgi:hypothetical protein
MWARSLIGFPWSRAIAVLAVMESCGDVVSLHPLVGDEGATFDARLVGTWQAAGDTSRERWVVMRADSTAAAYYVVVTDSADARVLPRLLASEGLPDDDSTLAIVRASPAARRQRERDSLALAHLATDSTGPRVFAGRLGEVGGQQFLDLIPALDQSSHVGRRMVVPAHWFWRVDLSGDVLRLSPLHAQWVEGMLDSNRVQLAHDREGDVTVLTASTAELQRFVARYATDTLAFPRKGVLEFRRR